MFENEMEATGIRSSKRTTVPMVYTGDKMDGLFGSIRLGTNVYKGAKVD